MKPKTGKIRVGVIFGGRSAEHEVSLVSAASIISALDKRKYDVVPIGITLDGRWLSYPDILNQLKSRKVLAEFSTNILLPDPTIRGLIKFNPKFIQTSRDNLQTLDVIFPVLHGTFGEDGTMQGLLELAGLPYVGAGVLGSAAGMDKIVTKQLCERVGIPITPYVWFLKKHFQMQSKKYIAQIEKSLCYPCFVKPANLGSSVGITKAKNRKELLKGIELAAEYDRRILVEQGIENAREIEVAVLGNDEPIASVAGEIISSNEFYDYDAKYIDGKSQAIIPAKLPKAIVQKLQDFALRGFRAIDCAGMARIDFLVTEKKNRIFLNEINTIPGFTSISMYPKLWEASGIPYSELLDRLIHLAIERHRERRTLKISYQPKSKWYQV